MQVNTAARRAAHCSRRAPPSRYLCPVVYPTPPPSVAAAPRDMLYRRLLCISGVCVAVAVAQGQRNSCPAVVTTQPACSTYCSSETFKCQTSTSHTRYAPAVVWTDDAGTQWCKCQCCEKPLGICGPNDHGPKVYYSQQCRAAHAGTAPPGPPSPPHDAPSPPPSCADAGVVDGPTCAAKCGAGRSSYKSVNDAGQCDCNDRRLCGKDVESQVSDSPGGKLKFIFVVLLVAALCGGAAFAARRHHSYQKGDGSQEPLVVEGF